MQKDFRTADFHYLWHLKCKLSEQCSKMEGMLIELLDEFSFIDFPQQQREVFSHDFLHLIHQIKEAEMKVNQELDGPNWIDCINCRGEGGKYYYEWENCQKCRGHGKIRKDPE